MGSEVIQTLGRPKSTKIVHFEPTVKRLEKKGKQVLLHAENEAFSPIKVDLATQPFNIEGIAVGVIRNADWM